MNSYLVRQAPDILEVAPYDVRLNFINYLLGGFLGGLLFAVFELYFLKNLFLRYGLITMTLGRLFFFLVVYFLLNVLLSMIYHMQTLGGGLLDSRVLEGVLKYMSGPEPILNLAFFGLFAGMLIFIHQIIPLVGRGVLGKFLFGRFKKPGLVHRTFLFLDMNSSTSVAERVGHVEFFRLMQDFLVQAGEEIQNHGGEIYKYVGDEIIATWNIDEGARRARALQCVQSIGQRLYDSADYFQSSYGVVPDFKAGLHVGQAMVGELGHWKREVAYMGDSLNVTSRIQSACKSLKARILLSEDYHRLMIDHTRFKLQKAARGKLRGRESPMTLYKVECVNPSDGLTLSADVQESRVPEDSSAPGDSRA